MDRQISAAKAWAIPIAVKHRLGTFEFGELAGLSLHTIRAVFLAHPTLHHFPNVMARLFHLGVQRIARQYDGDASRIWSGGIGSATLVRRFLEFDGVGPKIATMAANILGRDFGIPLADHRFIDISVDRHVKRVFSRLALIPQGASNFEVIYVAREMDPDYPGISDLACWRIGHDWCRPGKPKCPECVMQSVCPGAKRFHAGLGHPSNGVGSKRMARS